MFILCYWFDQKTGLCLLIKFGHAQISVPKMSIPISKTASVKPWFIIDKMKSY